MSFLKNHLSLILPLTAFLLSLQFYLTVDGMVEAYERKVNSTYSIVVAVEKGTPETSIRNKIPHIHSLEEIDPNSVLDTVKTEISPANLALLKISLPKFYKITLENYPNHEELERIRSILDHMKGVRKVETFAKTHDQIFRLLVLVKTISTIFAVMTFLLSFLLMTRQVAVWKYEHLERMEIMALFGAPFWMRSVLLYRMALLDSMLSALLVSLLFYWMSVEPDVLALLQEVGLIGFSFDPALHAPLLLIVALGISLLSVMVVIKKQGR